MVVKHIEVGDTVWLKSGGPPMTINKIYDNSYECIWMCEYNDTLQRAVMSFECVTATPDESKFRDYKENKVN